MASQQNQENMLDPNATLRLRNVTHAAGAIKRAFAGISTPGAAQESVFEGNEDLQIYTDETGLVTDIAHFGTKIRFECRIALHNDTAVGRVICTLRHNVWGPEQSEFLGAFQFSGTNTDLLRDERGHPARLPQDADLIVAHFLHKAHQANLVLHTRQQD